MNELPEIKIIDIGYASAGLIEVIATRPSVDTSSQSAQRAGEQSAPSDDG